MTRLYKLSRTLAGHTGDVRALSAAPACAGEAQALLSSSRDACSLLWRLPAASAAELKQPERLASHQGYVNSNAFLPTAAGRAWHLRPPPPQPSLTAAS
jgi:hypothetical protein